MVIGYLRRIAVAWVVHDPALPADQGRLRALYLPVAALAA